MIDQISTLMDEYWSWLRDKTQLRSVGEWVEITTPYLDRHNDYIQIYAGRDGQDLVLTDDGYTIQDLRLSGCDLSTPKRKHLLKVTLNGFGVTEADDALISHATNHNFMSRKHNLVQAMLAVNDLFYLAPATVRSVFLEDVEEWLNLSDVRFVKNVKFTGKTGFDHLFNFVIPPSPSRQAPERVIQTINRPGRDTAQSAAFSWIDTRDVRREDSVAYAILNDSSQSPSADVIDALKSYAVRPVLWSDRESVRHELAV